MNADLQKITDDLLALPAAVRIELAERLVESVDDFVDEEIRQVWTDEAARRVADYEAGKVTGIPAEDVIREAKERLDEARRLSSGRP